MQFYVTQHKKEVSSLAGGRWDFVQGGTSHVEKVDDALSKVPGIVKEILER